MEKCRILVIEDDIVLGRLIAEAFRGAGFVADHAADGAIGLSAFRLARHDVVVTDIIMPEREGLETLMAIKKESPQTIVIAMSGGGRIGASAFLELALRIGAERAFQKPFRPSELVAAVTELWQARAATTCS